MRAVLLISLLSVSFVSGCACSVSYEHAQPVLNQNINIRSKGGTVFAMFDSSTKLHIEAVRGGQMDAFDRLKVPDGGCVFLPEVSFLGSMGDLSSGLSHEWPLGPPSGFKVIHINTHVVLDTAFFELSMCMQVNTHRMCSQSNTSI